MKKLLLLALFFPFLASAAWWNPLTWFEEKATFEAQTASSVEIPVDNEPIEPEIIEVVKEVPVETIKEVVKTETITVQDPALQARINQLVAENSSLRSQLLSVQSDLGQCQVAVGNKSAEEENQAELERKAAANSVENAQKLKELEIQMNELSLLQSELNAGKYVYGNDRHDRPTSTLEECQSVTLPAILKPFKHEDRGNYCMDVQFLEDAHRAIGVEHSRIRVEMSKL